MKITPEQAAARAKAFLNENPPGMRMLKAQAGTEAETLEYIGEVNFKVDEDASMYLFKDSDAYTLTPNDGDEAFIPVLGQWDITDSDDSMPPGMVDWIKDFEDEIKWYQTHGAEEVSEQDAMNDEVGADIVTPTYPDTWNNINPLLGNTAWNQNEPYHDNLPKINNQPVKAGCPSIAISQILYYWACVAENKNYIGCKPIEAGKTNKSWKALEPKITFDYDHMAANNESLSPEDSELGILQRKAAAELCEYVAKGVKSTFGIDNTTSTAKRVFPFLKDKLTLKDSVEYITSYYGTGSNYSTMNSFVEAIYNELAAGRPVLLAGFGDGGAGGHIFVCDGYKKAKHQFHFNWGWGTSAQSKNKNGWFAMTALNTTAGKFNYKKYAFIGIEPYTKWDLNGDNRIDVTDAMIAVDCVLEDKYLPAADINNDGKVTFEDVKMIVDSILGK